MDEKHNRMIENDSLPDFPVTVAESFENDHKLVEHRVWLNTIRHEHPNPKQKYHVGIYIRYFNQTKYSNYLEYHIQQYKDTMALLPNWELVGFYVDEGQSTPNMENAKEWCRLLNDCFSGKVDLIITQKISNVTKKHYEITILSRILAALEKPVGIYFISEDIFTLATYYQNDLHDSGFFPSDEWRIIHDPENDSHLLSEGGDTDD